MELHQKISFMIFLVIFKKLEFFFSNLGILFFTKKKKQKMKKMDLLKKFKKNQFI